MDKPGVKIFFKVVQEAASTEYASYVAARGFFVSFDKAYVRLKRVTELEITAKPKHGELENSDRPEMRIPYVLLEPVPPAEPRDNVVVCDPRSEFVGQTWFVERLDVTGHCKILPNSRAKQSGIFMDAKLLAKAKLRVNPKRH